MIPIRDTIQSRRIPIINYTLIGLNIFFYIVQLDQGVNEEAFIFLYGLLPARFSIPEVAYHFTLFQQFFSFISYMFLHGGFLHLLGNIWTLYIFGDNVEDYLGPMPYLFFYLLCGIASGLAHVATNWFSPTPTIGASGAIAGVMGAYFLLHPKAKILTLVPIFFIPYFVEIYAFVFLGIWFLLQVVNATGSSAEVAGIAWWAHIGGFVFGIVLLNFISRMPDSEFNQFMKTKTIRSKSYHLQVIRPYSISNEDPHLYGTIQVLPSEALNGSRKVVNIPKGLHDRLIRISIPEGIQNGFILRLNGQGKQISNQQGDLLLTVNII